MQVQSRRVYQFGAFHLNAAERLLLKDEQVVTLTPKAFDALVLLVENSGRLISKETLLAEVWRDSFVEENTVNRSISTLRKALGETAGLVKYIETVPKHGYRFVAEVSEAGDHEPLLILEKHTSAEIITEEESTDRAGSELEDAFAGESAADAVRTQQQRAFRWQRYALPVAGLTALILLGVAYLLMTAAANRKAPPATLKSIAVLPLKSFAHQYEDEELRLRITDALITRLGNLNGISVRPTNSILRFATEDSDAIEAGRRLEVDAVLDGRIQTEGERLRVTLQLVSVGTGEHLWSGQFDGKLREILNLQDKISAQLLPILSTERTNLPKNRTTTAEVYELYLKGRFLWNRRLPPDMQNAIPYFEQAIALDPNFAPAYAGLADAYSMLTNHSALPRFEGYANAKAMAQKALEIDPNLSEAYSALGWILHKHEWSWAEAETAFARAIELNPNNAEAHHWRGLNFEALGKPEEFIASMEKARQLAPLTKAISQAYYFVVLKKEGCERAFKYLDNFNALFGNPPIEQANVSGVHHVECGDYQRAIAIMEQFPSEKLSTKAQGALGAAYAKVGNRRKALEIIEGIKQRQTTSRFYWIAYGYVALGDFDTAYAQLERGIEARDDRFTKLKLDRFLAPLRSDARFNRLLKKMNLPE